jgi:hypothetical protein
MSGSCRRVPYNRARSERLEENGLRYRHAQNLHQPGETTAGYAGRIHDTLASAFGADVFIDIDDISRASTTCRRSKRIAGCDVMLTHRHRWLDSQDASDSAASTIRRFRARRDRAGACPAHPVIPVLIGTATMPGQADLPADISQLATLRPAR